MSENPTTARLQQQLQQVLQQVRLLPLLPRLLGEGRTAWLVGGVPRDLLLGRVPKDFDLATPFDPTELAQDFARQTAGTWFWLDRERRQSRVVRKPPSGPVCYDFAPLRAATLDEDLALRDFSCNALAVTIDANGPASLWLDPLAGQAALAAGRLEVCGPTAMSDDPLRVLRGIRYAVQLDLAPSSEALQQMATQAPACRRMPAERIGQELFAIFGTGDFARATELLQQVGLFALAFGSRCPRGRIQAGVRLVQEANPLLKTLLAAKGGQRSGPSLYEEWQPGVDRVLLLRLTLFLRGAGLGQKGAWLARAWRLGQRPSQLIDHLVQLSDAPWQVLQSLADTPRARARWAEELGPAPVEAALLLCLLHPGDRTGQRKAQQALADWQQLAVRGRVPDLVNGLWLQQALKLPRGPLLGKLLTELRQAELQGLVLTPEQARAWCRAKIVDKG